MARIQQKREVVSHVVRKIEKSEYADALLILSEGREDNEAIKNSRKLLNKCVHTGMCYVVCGDSGVCGVGGFYLNETDDTYTAHIVSIKNDRKKARDMLIAHIVMATDQVKDVVVKVQKKDKAEIRAYYLHGFRVFQEYPNAYYMRRAMK